MQIMLANATGSWREILQPVGAQPMSRMASFALLFLAAGASLLRGAAPPSLPFYDWNACPAEGCVYRQWTARKPVAAYDTYNPSRHQVATLKVGERVTALTGVVITYKPGVIRIDRDFPSHGLKTGDTILTYAYRGEGESAVWLKGEYHSDFDISFVTNPDGSGCQSTSCFGTHLEPGERAWWAKVKLSSGRIAWLAMDSADLDGACALASDSAH
jgi:hypothetical protein